MFEIDYYGDMTSILTGLSSGLSAGMLSGHNYIRQLLISTFKILIPVIIRASVSDLFVVNTKPIL